jgi:site-specific recombinase XerD
LGGACNGTNVTHQFAAKLKNAVLPHIITGAVTLLLAQGVALKTTREFLGHSTIAVTPAY